MVPPEQNARPPRAVFRYLVLAVLLVALIGLAGYIGGRQFWAWHHYREAQQAVERRDFVLAQANLADCLEVWSSSAETCYEAARVARRAGNYDDAEKYLVRAQKLGWVRPAIDLERTLARVQQGNVAGEDVALLDYVEKNKGDPEVPIILEALSKGYLQSYRLPQARATLTKWLEIEPRNTQALVWRGGVLSRLGNVKGAEDDYRQAVEVNPALDEARVRLAETLLQRDNPHASAQQALEQLLPVQAHQPDNPVVLYDLALCKHDLNEPDEARAILDRLLDQHRDEVQTLKQSPQVGPPLGPQEDWWRQAIELAPFDLRQPQYVITLFVLILTERAELAATPAEKKAFLSQAAYLSPYDLTVTRRLADCLERLGDPEAKVYRTRAKQIQKDRDLEAQVRHDIMTSPHDPEPRYRAAEILLRHRQPQEAARWLESALREDPNYTKARELLRRCSELMGARAGADEAGDQGPQGPPPNP